MRRFLLLFSLTLGFAHAETLPTPHELTDQVEQWVRKKDWRSFQQAMIEWRGSETQPMPLTRSGFACMNLVGDVFFRFSSDDAPQYARAEKFLQAWSEGNPHSPEYRIALVHHLASLLRNRTFSPAKKKEAWQRGDTALREAEAILGRSADWYDAYLELAACSRMLVRDKLLPALPPAYANWLTVTEEGIKKYPKFSRLYIRPVSFLESLEIFPPLKGSWERWSRHVCSLLPMMGLEPYTRFHIALEARYYDKMFAADRVNWADFATGYRHIIHRSPDPQWSKSWMLYYARKADDKETAKSLLAELGQKRHPQVFDIEVKFLEIQHWAAGYPLKQPRWTVMGRKPHTVAYSKDGQRVYAGLFASKLSVLEAQNGKLLKELPLTEAVQSLSDIAESPDGRYLAATTGRELEKETGHCKVWSTSSMAPVAEFQSASGPFRVLSWGSSSQQLVVGGGLFRGPSQVWYQHISKQAQLLPAFSDHKHSIEALCWASDSGRILSNCDGGWITSIHLTEGKEHVKQVAVPTVTGVASMSLSPDKRTLAAALRRDWDHRLLANGSITLLDAQTLQQRKEVLAPLTGGLLTVQYSPDGKYLATGGYDGYVYILDSQSLEVVKWWNAQRLTISSVSWSPDGKQLATAQWNGEVCMWEL